MRVKKFCMIVPFLLLLLPAGCPRLPGMLDPDSANTRVISNVPVKGKKELIYYEAPKISCEELQKLPDDNVLFDPAGWTSTAPENAFTILVDVNLAVWVDFKFDGDRSVTVSNYFNGELRDSFSRKVQDEVHYLVDTYIGSVGDPNSDSITAVILRTNLMVCASETDPDVLELYYYAAPNN